MSDWPQLDAAGQGTVLKQLTAALIESAPEDWQRITLQYRQLGGHIDVRTGVAGQDGAIRVWSPPKDVWYRFQDLRGGMYVEGQGTWFAAQYTLDRPDRFSVQYNRETEPAFKRPLVLEDYLEEQREFPRTEEHMPVWYRTKLAEAG
jgi:hypothetical protein